MAGTTLISTGAQCDDMARWLRLGGWLVLGLIALWVVAEVVQLVLGIVSWVMGTLISLVVLALVLSLGYLLVSRLLGGDSGGAEDSVGSRTHERDRERIFE